MADEAAFGSQYMLGEVIGRGAMGRVFRGSLRSSGELVAVKVLRDDLSGQAEVVARFVQERQALRAIRHENVVAVRDLVVEGDQLGIVMDLVEGGDLRGLMRQRVTPTEAALYLSQMARGLSAVHAAGVVHRDLKPENVLVRRSDAGPPQLLLTDFGVARLVGQSMTKVTSMIGTPGYLAPESSLGARTSSPADIYALGVIFYELLSGEPPFIGDNVLAVVRAHADDPVPGLLGLPEPAWDLLSQMLDKSPDNRPTASTVADRAKELVGLLEPYDGFTVDRVTSPAAPSRPAITEPIGSASEAGTRIVQRSAEGLESPASKGDEVAPTRRGRTAILVGSAIAILIAGILVITRPWSTEQPAAATAPLEYAFKPTVSAAGVVVNRSWSISADTPSELTSEVTVINSGDGEPTESHYEVIPKSVAADVSQVSFEPTPTEVVNPDPIVRYDLTGLAPGESMTIRYTVALTGDMEVTEEALSQLAADQLEASQAFYEAQGLVAASTLTTFNVQPDQLEMTIGEKAPLAADGLMEDGTVATKAALKGINWTSSDPLVATVGTGGVVRAKGPGVTTITGQLGELTDTVSVTVIGDPSAGSEDIATATTRPSSGGVTPTTKPPTPTSSVTTTTKVTTTTVRSTTTTTATTVAATTTSTPTTPAPPPPPQPSVTVSKGDLTSSCNYPCYWVRVTISNLAPPYKVVMYDSHGYWGYSGCTYTTSSSTTQYCFFGYTGDSVYVVVNDAYQSNTATW